MNKSKLLLIIIATIAVIAIPLTIFQAQQQQDIRQRAAETEPIYLKITLDDPNTPLTVGSEIDTTLHLINNSAKTITALDATIKYNSRAFQDMSITSQIIETAEKRADDLMGVYSQIFHIPGEIRYIAINNKEPLLVKNDYQLAHMKFKVIDANERNTISINAYVTALGESGKTSIQTNETILLPALSIQPSLIPSPNPTPLHAPNPLSIYCGDGTPCPAGYVCDTHDDYCSPSFPFFTPLSPIPIPTPQLSPTPSVTIDSIDTSHQLEDKGYITVIVTSKDIYGHKITLQYFYTGDLVSTLIGPLYQPKCKQAQCTATFQITTKPSTNTSSTLALFAAAIVESKDQNSQVLFSEKKLVEIPAKFDSPSISHIEIDPQIGMIGTKFTVYAVVTSQSPIEQVKAHIKFNKSSWLNSDQDSLMLSDDGLHGDEKPNDGVYANVWDSRGKGLIKEVTVEAQGVGQKLATLNRAFQIQEESCQEALPGNNNKNTNRVNVVFVGANYGNLESFTQDIAKSIDFNGTEGGLLSQEPFKSNKDKFNFWYSNQIQFTDDCGGGDINLGRIGKFLSCRATVHLATDSCVVNNKQIIGLISKDFTSIAFGQTAYVSTFVSYYSPSIVVHEFGHSFGKLSDEYIGGNVFNPGGIAEKAIGEKRTVENRNIFKGTEKNCLSPKNPWYNLIGRGCGVDKTVDCIKEYNPDKDELICLPGVDEESCSKEVSCFKGAGIPENWRPNFNSAMRDSFSIDLKNFSRGYGPVNERELCKKIKEQTGSAGGICNEYGL